MKHFLIFSVIVFFCLRSSAISLPQAILQKKVTVSFENNGNYKGLSTQVTINNLSNQDIDINSEPGLIIQSEEQSSQSLVISEPIVAKIIRKKSFVKMVSTFCINSFKGGPQPKENYTFLRESDVHLKQLISFIYIKKTKPDDSQSAVWACENGRKDLYISDKKVPNLIELQKLVFKIYEQKLALGLISKDTTPLMVSYNNYHLQGSYDFFVKQEGEYTVQLEDSLGNNLYTFLENRNFSDGLYPIRYMHAYADAREKPFYIAIYKDGSLLEKVLALNQTNPTRYERLSVKSSVIFNLKNPVVGNLDLKDSVGNTYVNYFKNRNVLSGIVPFDFSFTIYKPAKAKLYLVLTDNTGKVHSRQKVGTSQNLMALKGYFYVRLQQSADAIFGLYSADDELLEEFDSKRYNKGLQMLPYGFMFDKSSKDYVFLKLKDKKTGVDIQSEKVFVK